MLALGSFKKQNVLMPEFNDMELFKVFRDFDEDSKGFLEPSEFYHCLQSFKPLALTPAEITTLVLLCDCEMDMRIDYAMIMTIFRDFLFQMKFTMQLHDKYAEEQKLDKQ
jgi:Ca2+-binding EF-hand superfamily protein